jgi:hypothetical protein
MGVKSLYSHVVRWVETLSRGQYALGEGIVWFIVWIATGLLLDDSLFWGAMSVAGVGAFVCAGVVYWWGPHPT